MAQKKEDLKKAQPEEAEVKVDPAERLAPIENVASLQAKEEGGHENAFVSLRHIDKVYDNNVQAVFDFNLDIKKHEFIVFVGPSGCGKSTT